MNVSIDWSKIGIRKKVCMISALADFEALRKLATDDNPTVREAVASNKHTAGLDLAILSTDSVEKVRIAVAKNTSAPITILDRL